MSRGGHRGFTRPDVSLSGTAPVLEGATGDYWAPPSTRTTFALTSGTMYTKMLYVLRDRTIDRIGAAVTVGAAGSTVTLGVYEDDGTGIPGTLLLDAGTIDGNSATAQEKTISRALTGGKRYHLAALCAGGTPTVRGDTGVGQGWVGRATSLATATGTTSVYQGRARAGIVGTALPAPAGATALSTAVPTIVVRFG